LQYDSTVRRALSECVTKLAFHGADTDTDTDILADFRANVGVSGDFRVQLATSINQSINHLFAQDKIKMAITHTCIKRAGQQGHFGTNSCP